MRLSAKVTLLIFLGALCSTTLVSFVTFQFTEKALETVMSNSQLALARSTMDSLDRVFEGYYRDMSGIGASLEAFSKENKNTDSYTLSPIALATGPWQFLVTVRTTDQTSRVWYGSPNEKENVRATRFAQEIVGTNIVQYSDALLDTGLTPLMLFAVPISDDEVVVGAMQWNQVTEVLNQLDSTSVFLFNKQQYLLASNQYELKIRTGIDQLSYPELTPVFYGSSVIVIGQNLYHNIARHEGNDYQALLTAVPERGFKKFNGNSWAMIIERPEYLAFESARSQAIYLIVLIIGFLLIAFSSALIFLRTYITSPVGKLTQVAHSIAAGNFQVQASIDSHHADDEIGELAKAFNTMTAKLIKAYQLLDRKFREIASKNTALVAYDHQLRSAMGKLRKSKTLIIQAKAKVESILESIGDGVIATDSRGDIVMINSQAAQILGFIQEEVVGRPIEQAFVLVDTHGKTLPASRIPLRRALTKMKTITTAKYAYICKNGRTLPVIITSSVLMLGKKVMGALDVFHDLSEERKIDQAKTEFVSLASHQLRMPLSIVNWYTEMLLSGEVGEFTQEQKGYLEEIYQGNQRMTHLVNVLLSVSRIETGTFVPTFHPVALDECITTSITEIEPLAIKKNITLEKRFPQGIIPLINTDIGLVQILLQNLLSNSIKYTPKGGKITVKLKKEPRYLVIEVKDTGYGIPQSEKKHIFTKLFRASNIKEKDTDGTGLGLYIVKAIVKQLKGKIHFISKEGKGTTFFVHLPY